MDANNTNSKRENPAPDSGKFDMVVNPHRTYLVNGYQPIRYDGKHLLSPPVGGNILNLTCHFDGFAVICRHCIADTSEPESSEPTQQSSPASATARPTSRARSTGTKPSFSSESSSRHDPIWRHASTSKNTSCFVRRAACHVANQNDR